MTLLAVQDGSPHGGPDPHDGRHGRPSWWLPLGIYAWAQLVLLMWWAGRYPALFSFDSLRYVIHVTTGPWTADHSVLYDWFILGSLTLTHNVGLITLTQTIVWAAAIAYTCSSLRAFGVPGRWAMIPGLILPFVPSFGAFVVTLWKDVPFAIAECFLAATTVRLLVWRRTSPPGLFPVRLMVGFGLEFLALVLFRNDGFIMLVFVVPILIVAFPGLRRKFAVLGIGALVAFALAETVVYPAAGIQSANSSLAYGTFYGDIAVAYAKAPQTFTKADTALMSRVAPLSRWSSASTCLSSDPLFAPDFNRTQAGLLKSNLRDLWFRVAARSPWTVVHTRLCRSSIAWNPLPSSGVRGFLGEAALSVPKDLYGRNRVIPADIWPNLSPHPIVSALRDVAYHLQLGTNTKVWQVLIWRGPVWCYLAYLALTAAALRLRRPAVLAAGAACMANQLTVLAANPAQLYRYMAGPIFLGMLLVPILAVRPVRSPDPTGPSASSEDQVTDSWNQPDHPVAPSHQAL